MRTRTRLIAVITAGLVQTGAAWAGTGGLDPTFGAAGARFINIPVASGSAARGVAVQPDGKVVTAGSPGLSLSRFTVVRHNADGSLDTGFNGSGVVAFAVGNGGEQANAVALQPDGKIVVAGMPAPVGGTSTGGFALARLNPDGSLDAGFGNAGRVVTPSTSSGQVAYAVAIQADGKIVAAGTTGADFVVVRYDTAGNLDATFNGSGRSVVSLGGGNDIAYALALQPDGRIVVAGVANQGTGSDFGLARLNADGTPDVSFNGSGALTTDFSGGADIARSVLVQPDGAIVAGGSAVSGSFTAVAVARYASNGAPDATFGTGGRAILHFAASMNDEARALALRPDGKIVAAGNSSVSSFSPSGPAVMRLNTDGSLDASFGASGVSSSSVGDSSTLQAATLRGDGRIVAAGGTRLGAGDYFLALQMLADGGNDPAFAGSGFALTSVNGAVDSVAAIALQANGSVLLAGATGATLGVPAPMVVARLDSNGSLDTAFGSRGVAHASGCTPGIFFCGSVARDVVALADGRIVVAGSTLTTGFNTGSTTTGPMAWMVFSAAGSLLQQRTESFEALSEALAMVEQPDGKLVTVGYSYRQGNGFGITTLPHRIAIVRHDAAGALDASFGGGTGKVTTLLGAGVDGNAVALQADGKIVVAGSTSPWADSVLVRYNPDGSVDTSHVIDLGAGQVDLATSVAVQADGKILIAGMAALQGYVARFSVPGVLDTTFGTGGKVVLPTASSLRMVLQPDGKILASTTDFEVFRLNTDGTPDATFGAGGRVTVALGGALASTDIAMQPGGRIVLGGHGIGTASQSQDFLAVGIDPLAAQPLVPAPQSVAFTGQSMHTTSLAQTLTLSNATGATIAIGATSVVPGSPQGQVPSFAATSACASVAAGASCDIALTFTPQAQGAILGTLKIPSTAGLLNITLSGIGERSLVTHYYRAILNRVPDDAGRAYWDGEAVRLASLGANLNETWFVMAGYFFNSTEYLAANKSDTQFLADLYNTFFNRPADPSGTAYWTGQIANGMPREVVLFSFLFSDEFRTFTQGIFGNTAARPEVDMVMDLFRGILNRLPDTSSFQYWVQRLRTAQCSGAGYVYSEVDAMSRSFMFSSEYANRARTNTQLVTDMYYSFLRRGGDLGGVNYWIDELQSGRRSADAVRAAFIATPEFGARVQAVIAAGCMP